MTGALIFALQDTPAHNGFHPMDCAHGTSALQRMVIAFHMTGVKPVLVLSRQRGNMEQHLARMGAICMGPDDLSLEDYRQYILRAVSFLRGKCRRVFLAPASHPLFAPETVTLLSALHDTPLHPAYESTAGFPLLATLDEIEQKCHTHAGIMPDTLVQALNAQSQPVPVKDGGVALNLGEFRGWMNAMEARQLRMLRPVSKIMVARERVFLGPGAYQLLHAIQETGAVRNACELIGISYTKGRRIIDRIERQSGLEIVRRQKGGLYGGSTRLSAEGEALFQTYTAYLEECNAAIEQIFIKHFSGLQERHIGRDD